MTSTQFVVGLDNGGTTNNATVMTLDGRFLIDELWETPSQVRGGPLMAIPAMVAAFEDVIARCAVSRNAVVAIGLDTPGPASPDGVLSASGSVNFGNPEWASFDVRAALEAGVGLPVIYNNDGNAAALYAHHQYFQNVAHARSSVAVVIGTGLGGGLVVDGRVIRGAGGMAGELGHVRIVADEILEADQPLPICNCGQTSDAESFASLTAISKNLLPYWLKRFPGHPLASLDLMTAARKLRGYGANGDEMALAVFAQQAHALGALLGVASNFTDPNVYFIGGGLMESEQWFQAWFIDRVEEHTSLRAEQRERSRFSLIPTLDMAGARGSAVAAAQWTLDRRSR